MPRTRVTTEWRVCDLPGCQNQSLLYDTPSLNDWPRDWVTVFLERGLQSGKGAPIAYFCSEPHAAEWMGRLAVRPAKDWDFDTQRFTAVLD